MREAIELHDSTLLSLTQNDKSICLKLKAYIHRAPEFRGEGGTGWTQEIELHLDGVEAVDCKADLPLRILDGRISGSESHENFVPLLCEISGGIQIEITGPDGHLTIRATRLRIQCLGDARFVEDTPAEIYTDSWFG